MKNIFIAITILIISGHCHAETEYLPDIKLEKCLAQKENYSTVAMTQCVATGTKDWDKELNSTYQSLMQKLDKSQKEELKAAQLAWINYRDLEIKNIASIYQKISGTMYQTIRADRVMNITKTRTIELKNYLRDLQEAS